MTISSAYNHGSLPKTGIFSTGVGANSPKDKKHSLTTSCSIANRPITHFFSSLQIGPTTNPSQKNRLPETPNNIFDKITLFAKAVSKLASSPDQDSLSNKPVSKIKNEGNPSVPSIIFAGAIAGLTEHLASYPLEGLFKRTSLHPGTPLSYLFNTNILRGVSSVPTVVFPAHAAMFYSIERVKENTDIPSLAGAVGRVIHDSVMLPWDAWRTQLLSNTSFHNNKLAHQWLRAITVGTLFNAPQSALMFGLEDRYNFSESSFINGLIVGAGTGALSTPLEHMKNNINTKKGPLTTLLPKTVKNEFKRSIKSMFRSAFVNAASKGVGFSSLIGSYRLLVQLGFDVSDDESCC